MIRFGDTYIDPQFISVVQVREMEEGNLGGIWIVEVALIKGSLVDGNPLLSFEIEYATEQQARTVAGNLVAAIKRYKTKPQ